jgi:DNA helicase II / ATP-dependent DNA helicase PcrA
MTDRFSPSHYQQAIFDFVRSGTGDGVVRATAGSGKTTTLVEIARHLPDDLNAVFLAFNKHTADELKARLPGHVQACTVHALGRRTLLQAFPSLAGRQPEGRKSRQLIRERIGELRFEFAVGDENWPVAEQYLFDLLKFAVANVTNTKVEGEVAALAVEYNLNPPPDHGLELQCHREVRELLRRRFDVLRTQQLYDYDDMLYIPAVHPKTMPVPQYDFVFVDEAQDLSAVQLRLVLRAVRDGGRRLFVGDERQAIYGFTGADADSLSRIVQATNATILPLSVTYRCPRTHVALAQRLAPELEAAPHAPAGQVFVIQEAWLGQWVRAGDLVICRYTAPLVKQCLGLIRRNIPAVVRGLDIARSLQDVAQLLFRTNLAGWEDRLAAYRVTEEARIRKYAASANDAERQVAVRMDLLDCLEVIAAEVVGRGGVHVAELTTYLQGFFSDDDRAPIIFSTIHKAKGKEADRVFILYPNTMPAVYARTATAARGEACVQFVALTRAKRDLIFVEQQADDEAEDAVQVKLARP